MAKVKSFADKMAKDKKDFTTHCPKCGESITTIKLVASELSEKTGAYRFKQSFVGVCKCNENDVTKPIDRGELIRPKPNQPAEIEPAADDKPQTAEASVSDTEEKDEKDQKEQTGKPESKTEETEVKDQKNENKASESGDKKSG
jgi:hypothetical protein